MFSPRATNPNVAGVSRPICGTPMRNWLAPLSGVMLPTAYAGLLNAAPPTLPADTEPIGPIPMSTEAPRTAP